MGTHLPSQCIVNNITVGEIAVHYNKYFFYYCWQINTTFLSFSKWQRKLAIICRSKGWKSKDQLFRQRCFAFVSYWISFHCEALLCFLEKSTLNKLYAYLSYDINICDDHCQVELIEEGTPRKLRVHYKHLDTGEDASIECNTVSARCL